MIIISPVSCSISFTATFHKCSPEKHLETHLDFKFNFRWFSFFNIQFHWFIGFYWINDRFLFIFGHIVSLNTDASVITFDLKLSHAKCLIFVSFLEHVLSGNLELSKNRELWSNLFDILECTVYSQNVKITKHDFRENFSKM